MKKLKYFIAAFSILIIFSCRNTANNNKNDIQAVIKNNPRNTSITKDNAYNNLFLDSTKVEDFIVKQKINDTIAANIRSFYNARNYESAWFTSTGLTEEALAFRSLYQYTNEPAKKSSAFNERMDELVLRDSMKVNADDASIIKTELQLTQKLIDYTTAHNNLRLITTLIPAKKQHVLQLADSLVNTKTNAALSDNESYASLKAALKDYLSMVKTGDGPPITASKKTYKKGMNAPEITLIKKRLMLSGDLKGIDTSALFNDTLVSAIKNFETVHGYKTTGILSQQLIKDMNVPLINRIQQIVINMQRMVWMPQTPKGKLIIVNIPEFVLHLYDGTNKVFDMVVVVGQAGHNTTMFSGNLNEIVFNPYWNLPPSIIKKEILPAISKDKNYLAEKHMEIVKEENGIPVVIRQLPGDDNSLGRMKFLFPNSFDIYFHDTPAKDLFKKDKRAFSHGCIRLSEPRKMADYLLKGSQWNDGKIDSILADKKEKSVQIEKPVPVLITYYTAWVDADNRLNFRDDIYGHDAEMAAKMFK
ncbi:murein L,D-transpeptidase [Chitinophagaceae bacterium LWZ2-11]